MPEVKNTFIQSKMNKDMDGRILPNGQYRDGRNIQISRSEGDDVGALENVLGNDLLTDFGFNNPNLEIIGHLMVDTLDTIFLFLTDYYDSSADQLSNSIAGRTSTVSGNIGECYIVSYNITTNTPTTLVSGNFLNFSKSHYITGVNLIEDLLFWTDNRNQPRKINITLAEPGYYTTEDQISVAKYYPYDPILLLDTKFNELNYKFSSSMKDKTSKYLPIHAAAKVDSVDTATGDITLIGTYTNIMPNTPGFVGTGGNGDLMSGLNVTGRETCIVETLSIVGATTEITVPPTDIANLEEGDVVYFQRENPDYDNTWVGDKNYLKDKFARFSYRFKFDDGEYSLSAPFTQIAFVPEQDGYFIGTSAQDSTLTERVRLVGQESETYDSTVVKFMQNKINDINLTIPAPTIGNGKTMLEWKDVAERMKIVEVDILYKEAQSNKTSIVETLTIENFGLLADNYLVYNYQSKKPWKTLPTVQTTRVTDVVPIRALAQESSGNRIIYGNFVDKHTSPVNLNYQIQVNEKIDLPTGPSDPNLLDSDFYVRKEYQNHTLKQNRNYQVGIVLADRYGRQSNVILSSVINTDIIGYVGSTFYHPYKSTEDPILTDKYPAWPSTTVPVPPTQAIPDTWPGDQINAIFWSIIPQLKTQNGYPGVYSVADGSLSQLGEITATPSFTAAQAGCCYTANIAGSDIDAVAQIEFCISPTGAIVDLKIISSGNGWINGEGFSLVNWVGPFPGPACDPTVEPFNISGWIKTPIDNPLGWYSYKFVVKQTEQEYYNVYLPGALAGYPKDQAGDVGINTTTGTIDITNNAAPPPDVTETVSTNESQAFPTIDFEYPKGQENHTCHIVLFGDNINKVPKDLQDVGPLTEKFRSSEQLYGRVTTYTLGLDGGIALSNKQYDPDQKSDVAVQIGSMVSLALGDLTINPVAPTLPPSFYKAETNPLIARVETNNQFGVPATDGGGVEYPYGPVLAIYETKPVESLLDIFWESSTSHLISDLNQKILLEDNTIPTGITDPNISWSEADDYGSYISATFEAAGAFGQGIGPVATIELDEVIRGDNAIVTEQFEIEETGGPGTGEYQLKIAPFTSANRGFLCWEDSLKNIYYFNLKVTYDPGITGQPAVVTIVQKEGFIVNAPPVEKNNPTLNDIKNSTLIGDGLLTPEQGLPNGPVNNSSSSLPGEAPWGLIRAFGTQGGNPNPDYKLLMEANSVSYNWGGAEDWSAQGSHFVRGNVCTSACGSPLFLKTDGFKASNGAWENAFPRSQYRGLELVYDIPRMYQVSMYLPQNIFSTQIYQLYNRYPYWWGRSVPESEGAQACGTFELIFGYNSYIPAAGNVDGGDPSIKGLPQGPIYWDFDTSQLDPSLGGEEFVGEKLNGGLHYWQDLRDIAILQSANPLPPQIPGIMKLQQGYNTFYSFYGPKPYGFKSMDGTPPTAFNTTQIDNVSNPTSYLNAGGYQMYLGSLDSDGLGPPRQFNNMRFWCKTGPVNQTSTYETGPREGFLYCGNPDQASRWFATQNGGTKNWDDQYPTQLLSTYVTPVFGNTLPPGRYVVTLRVRDKNGAGQSFEWDLPITIPPYLPQGSFDKWINTGGCP